MRTTSLWIAAGACLLAAGCSSAEPAGEEAVAPTPAQPKITISKETTFITGPLRPDGYPDYLAALNELTSRGVTPENNAAVPYWQAIGPKHIRAELRPQFFKMLGIKELPEKGAYLVSLKDFMEMKKRGGKEDVDGDDSSDRIWEQVYRAHGKPWSKDDFPEAFAWLTANEAPLQRIAEAVKRPRFYSPLAVKEGGSLVESTLIVHDPRDVTDIWRLLTARAMLRVEAGNGDDAWQDLLACHRLARLVGQGLLSLDYMQARLLEKHACRGDTAMAHGGNLTARQAAAFLAELEELPPLPQLASVAGTGNRYYGLDVVCVAARTEPGPAFGQFFGLRKDRTLEKMAADPRVDWDEVLRAINAQYDRLHAAASQSTYRQRYEAVDEFGKAAAERGRRALERATIAKSFAKDATSKAVSQELAAVLWTRFLDLVSADTRYSDTRDDTSVSLVRLAVALGGYRAEHGKYPPTLADLKPRYIVAIPKDPFTDKNLIYERQDGGKGYVLYSVGKNGRDEGGQNWYDDPDKYENVEHDKWPDDIAIRTPAVASGGAKE